MQKRGKRGFFFTLDAAFALMVIGIGMILMLSAYLSAPGTSQTGAIATDALSFLSTTLIENLNDPYAGISGTLWNQGKITQPKNTLLQQIGEFSAKGDEETASLFISSIVGEVIPEHYLLQILVDGKSVYPLQAGTVGASQESTDVLISIKSLVYGVLNTTTYELWGPSVVVIRVWHE